ncbi:hypothetical protein GCM10023328_34920 [Modestobacter marinus]|uniref:Uncharacterized protein n=1 Tax=Modestobacter marinus TaxID=477641 RepID=A0A846LGS6_9ACTN|nr:hypothetical protein [Modestobacter marinus]NIH65804.1 hypothetical protein [Modestobacter marinus]GGL67227.1 hypothetical protein GCM10011589_24430 [Modestobacter marinus]
MAESEAEPETDAESRSPVRDERSGRAVRWWLAAAAFVLGVFGGGLLVGLLSEGSAPVPQAAPAAPATDGAVPLPAAPPTGETAEVVVNAACLRAVNGAQDVVAVIDDLGEAVSEFNAARLDEVVRRLQPLQGRLAGDIAGCQVVSEVAPATPSGTPSGTPTGTPTGTPPGAPPAEPVPTSPGPVAPTG